MNKKILIVLTLLFSLSVNANEKLFTGTWALVSGEYVDHEGNLVSYEGLNLSSIKVISNSHFSFVTMAGDKFWSSGAGTYIYTDSEYIESPLHTSFNSPKGKKYVFKYKKDGNKWFSSRWENEKRVEYEVWKKISD